MVPIQVIFTSICWFIIIPYRTLLNYTFWIKMFLLKNLHVIPCDGSPYTYFWEMKMNTWHKLGRQNLRAHGMHRYAWQKDIIMATVITPPLGTWVTSFLPYPINDNISNDGICHKNSHAIFWDTYKIRTMWRVSFDVHGRPSYNTWMHT